MRRQSRSSSPAFAWRPTGCSESDPSFDPWKPIAVRAPAATGSWIRRLPIDASTCGRGRTAAASARETVSIAIGAGPDDPLEPKAVKSSVTTPSTASTESTTSRRARRWARRLRSRRRAACRERGEAIGATVPHACAGFMGCVARSRTGLRSLGDPGDDDPGPALDPARRPARAPARRISARATARARAVPVPHLRRDRVHAEPARPRPDPPAAPARRRGGGGLGGLRDGVRRAARRRRHGRRLRGPLGRRPGRRVLLGGERGHGEDGRRGRRRPAPAVARRPRARADPARAAAQRPDRLDRGERRLGVRAGCDLVRPGRGALGDPLPLLRRPRDRDRDLHAARHAAARGRDRPPLPAAGRPAADPADRARALGIREGAGGAVGGDRHERRGRDVDPRDDGPRRGRGTVRAAVRDLDGLRRGDPLHRAVALGGAAGALRARRRPGRRPVGRRALRLHLPDRGARGRPERDGERAPPPPAAGHLRAPRRRRAVRDPRRSRGAADDGRRARDLGVLRRADRARVVGGQPRDEPLELDVGVEPPRRITGS